VHGDFRALKHPGTRADLIDVDGTREGRRRWHELFRARRAEIDALGAAPIVAFEQSPPGAE
jgi:hypothetical protein